MQVQQHELQLQSQQKTQIQHKNNKSTQKRNIKQKHYTK